MLGAFALLVVISVAQPWLWPVAPGVPLSVIHAVAVPVVALLVWFARIPARYLFARLLAFAVPLTLVALSIPLAQGRAGGAIMAGVLTKGLLSFTIILCLVYTTSFERLLQALRQCGVPKLLVAVLASMHRFIFVLSDELERMRRAAIRPNVRLSAPAVARHHSQRLASRGDVARTRVAIAPNVFTRR